MKEPMNIGIIVIGLFILIGTEPQRSAQTTPEPLSILTPTDYKVLKETLEKAFILLGPNPSYRIHGMGFDPAGTIGGIVRKDPRITDFSSYTPRTKWKDVPSEINSRFYTLVNDVLIGTEWGRKNKGLFDLDSEMPEIWAEAVTDPHIFVRCCGQQCNFNLFFVAGSPFSGGVGLNYWATTEGNINIPTCQLGLSNPNTIDNALSSQEKMHIKQISFEDRGCKGKLKKIFIGGNSCNLDAVSPKAFQPIQDLYKKFLKAWNPVYTFTHSDIGGCDR